MILFDMLGYLSNYNSNILLLPVDFSCATIPFASIIYFPSFFMSILWLYYKVEARAAFVWWWLCHARVAEWHSFQADGRDVQLGLGQFAFPCDITEECPSCMGQCYGTLMLLKTVKMRLAALQDDALQKMAIASYYWRTPLRIPSALAIPSVMDIFDNHWPVCLRGIWDFYIKACQSV